MSDKLHLILNNFGISNETIDSMISAELGLTDLYDEIDAVSEACHYRVLHSMQKYKLSDIHFGWNTGYGYDDTGRETVEKIYADVFGGEDALVRPTIVNGTHALTLSLWGILRCGDSVVSITGKPYDTLDAVIGIGDANTDKSSLSDFGIKYSQIDLLDNGHFDVSSILEYVEENAPELVYIQRSAGYSWRKSLMISDIEDIVKKIKSINSKITVMADNCYGEFLELKEPCHVGVDIVAGSLIKNPGGGMALTGGYIVGKKRIIDRIAGRMTSPGTGRECGLTFGMNRSILHGFFIAPKVVAGAVKGASLCSQLFQNAGYEVCPGPHEGRSDIIQAIKLKTPEKVIAFCQAVQSAAPVDSFVSPIPWNMPGYTSKVIMAAGAFVQGSSIELSADAPLRDPYIVYFQGGLTYEHSKLGTLKAYESVKKV